MDAGPFVGILGQLITWSFFLVALAMFKNFITHGLSLAIAEFLLKIDDDRVRDKMCRWFVNGELVLERLKMLDEKLDSGDKK